MAEYNEVRGYANAAEWVYGQALEPDEWHDGKLLNTNEVRHIHYTAMTPVWDVAPHSEATGRETPGNFREHDIRPFSAGMTPPAWPLVPAHLDQWINDVCELGEQVAHGINPPGPLPEELARLHNRFEQIHPFLDGNGHTGRLLLNLILVRLGYPPVVIFKRQRNAYLLAIQGTDGVWRSSRKAVDTYQATRHQRRPRPY